MTRLQILTMKIETLLQSQRTIRVLGIDDVAYADKTAGSPVNLAGVVCAGTRFEGMLWGQLKKDGIDATDAIVSMVLNSKFHAQLHLILLDGITFGGANVAELPELQGQLGLPIVAVMRRTPNIELFRRVLSKLPDSAERLRRTDAAGEIYDLDGWVFQCMGEDPTVVAKALSRLTDNGKVPEALRVAHLVGSAVTFGESRCRA